MWAVPRENQHYGSCVMYRSRSACGVRAHWSGPIQSQRYRVMIPETENPLQAKSVYPGNPARHAWADPGRYFTQSPLSVFSQDGLCLELMLATCMNFLQSEPVNCSLLVGNVCFIYTPICLKCSYRYWKTYYIVETYVVCEHLDRMKNRTTWS